MGLEGRCDGGLGGVEDEGRAAVVLAGAKGGEYLPEAEGFPRLRPHQANPAFYFY